MRLSPDRAHVPFLFHEAQLGLMMLDCARLAGRKAHAESALAHAWRAYTAVEGFRRDQRLTMSEAARLDSMTEQLAQRLADLGLL